MWVTLGVMLTSVAFKPDIWTTSDEITGVTELAPGATAVLRVRATKLEGDNEMVWAIRLQVDALTDAGGEPIREDGQVLAVNGWLDGSDSNACQAEGIELDSGSLPWNECTIFLDCPADATECEVEALFVLVSLLDEPVRVGWTAWTHVQGSLACFRSEEKMAAELYLERVD